MKNPNQVGFNVEDTTVSDWDDIGDYFVKDDEINIDSLHDEKGNLTINHWNEAHADGELREKLHEYWGSDEVKEIQGDLREEQAKADEFTAQLQDIYDSVEAGKGKIEKRLQKGPNDEEIEVEYFINEKGYTQNLNVLKKHQAEHLDWVKHYEDKLTQGENEAAFGVMQNTAIKNAENHASQLSAEAKDIYEQLSGLKEGEISAKFNVLKIYDGNKIKREPSLEYQRDCLEDIFNKLDSAEAEKARAERLRNGEATEVADEEKSTFDKEVEKIEAKLYRSEKLEKVNAAIAKADEFFQEYRQEGEYFGDIHKRIVKELNDTYHKKEEVEREYKHPGLLQRIKNIFPSARSKFINKYERQLDELSQKARDVSWVSQVFREGARAQEFKSKPYDERLKIASEEGERYERVRNKVQAEANKRLLDMLKEQF